MENKTGTPVTYGGLAIIALCIALWYFSVVGILVTIDHSLLLSHTERSGMLVGERLGAQCPLERWEIDYESSSAQWGNWSCI